MLLFRSIFWVAAVQFLNAQDSSDEALNLLLDPLVGTGKPSSSMPVFLEEPEDSFVIKNKAAQLSCRAANALQLYFTCNGEALRGKQHSLHEYVDPMTGIRQVEIKADITRNAVDEYFGDFTCECVAWSSVGQQRSRRAKINVATLKKYFIENPYSTSVQVEQQVELRCLPPDGVPPPDISWLKNGMPIDPAVEPNYLISNEGHLLIVQASLADIGNYTCVAESIAGRRLSEVAVLTVLVNGGWSSWSSWGECTPVQGTCGVGLKKRSRFCNAPAPLNGGKLCPGLGVMKQDCSIPCPAVDGKWTSWSAWSICGPDCKQQKKRTCTSPPPSGSGRYCIGKDLVFANCTGGMCKVGQEALFPDGDYDTGEEVSSIGDDSDIALYVGVAVAIVVVALIILVVLTLRLIQNKAHRNSGYPSKNSGYHGTCYFANGKGHEMQPDLMQTVNLLGKGSGIQCCDYNYSEPSSALLSSAKCAPTSISEHLYELPQMPTPHSCSSHQAGQSSFLTSSTNSGNKPKSSLSDGSLSSTNNISTGSTSPYDTDTGISGIKDVQSVCAWGSVTSAGARIELHDYGIALTIPEGALSNNRTEDMYLALLADDRDRPRLDRKQTLLSPLISCGPGGMKLKKPVVITFQHSAIIDNSGSWSLTLLSSPRGPNESPVWEKVVSLGEETVNTPVYVHLDSQECHIVSDSLNYFALIGESLPGCRAIKQLRLATFLSQIHPMEYQIKVYVLEDVVSVLQKVCQKEARHGGRPLDLKKTTGFKDDGQSLRLEISDLSEGWSTKSSSFSQEIPFELIWCSQQTVYSTFAIIKRSSQTSELSCTISAKQSLQCQTLIRISRSDLRKIATQSPVPKRWLNSVVNSSRNQISTVIQENYNQPFRLPISVKRQLSLSLDPPNARGSDWRLLAEELKFQRYINFFATKPSPTEHILDLWEAKNKDVNAIVGLINVLRLMHREDAVAILEQVAGPWC
ncbi:netrin receptor UNC5C-like isoform X1 [Artemia franciscana]|uniref:Netrin receptor UNC5 n=1 Tax=Artemia franciscana TaxID=6661 RepID=A0AA88I2S0_ARTSF|nr:hypothetical protein QYM36_004353 [Artemia franciscana]